MRNPLRRRQWRPRHNARTAALIAEILRNAAVQEHCAGGAR